MLLRHIRPLLFLCALGAYGTLSAAPSPLATAVASAFDKTRQQPLVQALQNESEAIRRQAAELVAGDPALTLTHLNDRLDRNRGYAEWEVGVELPLWLPGQRDARKRVADATGDQAAALGRLLRLETAGKVREAAWEAAMAEGRLRLAESALDNARTLENTVARKVEAGELARLDLLLARQESADADVTLQEARAGLEQARTRLRLLTGLDQPVRDIREQAADAELNDSHPRLQLAALETARARAERDRTLTETRDNPSLSIGGKSQRDSRDRDYEQLLALEVRVPFGMSAQAAPRQAVAEQALTQRQVELHRTRAELERQLAAARLELEASRDAVTLAQQRQNLASDTLQLSQRAFELGETDLRQLIQTLQRSLRADLNLALRRIEQGRAVARLNQALGVLP